MIAKRPIWIVSERDRATTAAHLELLVVGQTPALDLEQRATTVIDEASLVALGSSVDHLALIVCNRQNGQLDRFNPQSSMYQHALPLSAWSAGPQRQRDAQSSSERLYASSRLMIWPTYWIRQCRLMGSTHLHHKRARADRIDGLEPEAALGRPADPQGGLGTLAQRERPVRARVAGRTERRGAEVAHDAIDARRAARVAALAHADRDPVRVDLVPLDELEQCQRNSFRQRLAKQERSAPRDAVAREKSLRT